MPHHPVHIHLTRAQKLSLLRGRGIRVAHAQCGHKEGHPIHLSLRARNRAMKSHMHGKAAWLLRPHEMDMERAHGEGLFDDIWSGIKNVGNRIKDAAVHVGHKIKGAAEDVGRFAKNAGEATWDGIKKVGAYIPSVIDQVAPLVGYIPHPLARAASLGWSAGRAGQQIGRILGRGTKMGKRREDGEGITSGVKSFSTARIAGGRVKHAKKKRKGHMVKGSAAAKAHMARLRSMRHRKSHH